MEIPDEASSVSEVSVADREQNRGLWETPTAQQEVDFTKKSQKAFLTIVMSISSPQLYLITSCEWTTLRDHFERDTLVNKLSSTSEWR